MGKSCITADLPFLKQKKKARKFYYFKFPNVITESPSEVLLFQPILLMGTYILHLHIKRALKYYTTQKNPTLDIRILPDNGIVRERIINIRYTLLINTGSRKF